MNTIVFSIYKADFFWVRRIMFGHKPLEVHPQIAYGEIHRVFHELSNNVFRFAAASKNVRKGKKTSLRGKVWVFVVSEFFCWKKSTVQSLHIGLCREFHQLSKYVIISLQMLVDHDNLPKMQCSVYFFSGDISACGFSSNKNHPIENEKTISFKKMPRSTTRTPRIAQSNDSNT